MLFSFGFCFAFALAFAFFAFAVLLLPFPVPFPLPCPCPSLGLLCFLASLARLLARFLAGWLPAWLAGWLACLLAWLLALACLLLLAFACFSGLLYGKNATSSKARNPSSVLAPASKAKEPLVVRPGPSTSSILFLVAMPGAPSSVLAPGHARQFQVQSWQLSEDRAALALAWDAPLDSAGADTVRWGPFSAVPEKGTRSARAGTG